MASRRLSVRLTDEEWDALETFVVLQSEDPETPITVSAAVRFLLVDALKAQGLVDA
jgi:hypothetical protein